MMEDFEEQLRCLQPAAPPVRLKHRLRARLESAPGRLPVLLLRLAIPAGALAAVALVLSRPGSSEPPAYTCEQIPARASTSLYFPGDGPPLQVTQTSSQAYVTWRDGGAGQ